jgi:chloramphenicol 3-O phosphotransferase
VVWYAGIAAMARAGGKIIVDEVFLTGADSQRRLRRALEGLAVLWVGVRCDEAVATAREAARVDRSAGMAARQVDRVHDDVVYDVEVDATRTAAIDCARTIATRVMRSDEAGVT